MGDQQQPTSYSVMKAVTAAAAGGSMLVISGLTMACTVIALAVATPLLMVFSPVLVPAAFTTFLLGAGFLSAGGLGLAALLVLLWMYRHLTGKRPRGAQKLDQARRRLASKAKDVAESAQPSIEQAAESSKAKDVDVEESAQPSIEQATE